MLRFAPLLVLVVLSFGLTDRSSAAEREPLVLPREDARRLEVLFLGAPKENGPHHDPITRYRSFKRVSGTHGINLTYSEDLAEALRPEFLASFDALLLYANWDRLTPSQEQALLAYVDGGRGFLPIHCASACFGHSDPFIELVGGRFKRHAAEVFSPVTVAPDHPAIRGVPRLEAWDETYVHDRHGDDRTILQVRRDAEGDEPWTWVRNHGQGRAFYTASGHDHRVWDQPAFQTLLIQAIHWAVGPKAMARLERLGLPELPEQEVLLPDYRQRKAITRAQVPLSPAESAKLIQVPPGFEVALFASEPDIVNPIYVGWDERGRAYVIETIDYPNNLQTGNVGHDRITICEDTTGDGRADKFTVFADGLSIPTSLAFVNGGVICTNGTQLLFLQDTNGDDRADVREVLLDGFKMHDTHAGPSNLRYGFDHWIYATIGYSGFEGPVGGQPMSFTTGVFRFSPDAQRLEFLQNTTNNTWGLGFTEEGFILGSTANANPSWVFTLPAERYRALGLTQPKTPRADDNPYFFPSSTDIRQVDAHDRYTSAAGHAFYTSRRFPAWYHNRIAFITEPTGKLVGQFEVTPQGASFRSRQLANNLFNSADAWTSPVAAEVGPDGAVWICDWYNLIVQHNPTPTMGSAGLDAVTGAGNAYATALRDKGHGRIWRVYPKGTRNEPAPELDGRRPETLVAALEHPNLLWRLHAQRLLVENGAAGQTQALHRLVRAESRAAVHAWQVLVEAGQTDVAAAVAAWDSRNRGLRRVAREWLAQHHPDEVRRLVLAGLGEGVPAEDARELAEVLAALSRVPEDEALAGRILATLLAGPHGLAGDPAALDGWQMAARAHAGPLLRRALGANLPIQSLDTGPAGHVLQVAAHVAAGARREAVVEWARRQQNDFARLVLSGLEAQERVAPAPQHPRDEAVLRRGAALYTNRCVACHGLDAQGVPGAFPPLANSEWVVGDPAIPIKIVLHGMQGPVVVAGQSYDSIMPPVVDLNEQDVADVVTYVRQSFGNDAAAVSVEQVRAVRRANWGRGMWTAEELTAPAR
jgi:uncharacterized protein